MSDLVLSAVSLKAGGRTLVCDLSLRLAPGERLALLGPNGSGKSTLLRAIAGLAQPAAGRIERPDGPPGMLFQDGALWPHLSVARHLDFVDPRGDRAWHERLLERLGLVALRDRRPDTLSGGERVRLGLARAFAPRPPWLLLDEPLAHLDARFEDLLRETLPGLLDEIGAAAVLVTHETDTVRLTAQRVLCLSGEGPSWLGTVREALERPPTPLLAALSGRGTLLDGTADAGGRVALPFGLSLDGAAPGARVAAFLDADGVRFAANGAARLSGVLVAPDGRGGSWVRVDGRLLRCGEPPGARTPGAPVGLSLAAAPRALDGAP
jgi:ABC-type sulfate/molybdate transport systems ATPase subunit